MKKFFLFLIILVIKISAQTTFQKTYGGAHYDWGSAFLSTNDGGYLIAGSSTSFKDSALGDVYLIKTNNIGDTLWTKIFFGKGRDYAISVQATSNGGYIVAGATNSFGAGDVDVLLMSLNANGDTTWTRVYGAAGPEAATYAQQTVDGGFIISGWSYSFDNTIYALLIKTAANGDITWSKLFGQTGTNNWGNFVQQTKDSGYVVGGQTADKSWLLKTDQQGNKVWDKTYAGVCWSNANCIKQTRDGGYIMAGYTAVCGTGQYASCYLVKTDLNGDTIWTKAFSTTTTHNESYSVEQTSDGGYILAGVNLIRTDSIGNVLWIKNYGGVKVVTMQAVQQTTDSGFAIVGYENEAPGNTNFYFIKTDLNGSAGCEVNNLTLIDKSYIGNQIGNPFTLTYTCELNVNTFASKSIHGGLTGNPCSAAGTEPAPQNSLQEIILFPNPTTAIINIQSPEEISSVEIRNIVGEKVYSNLIPNKIDLSEKPKGIYFIEIFSGGRKIVKKISIE